MSPPGNEQRPGVEAEALNDCWAAVSTIVAAMSAAESLGTSPLRRNRRNAAGYAALVTQLYEREERAGLRAMAEGWSA